MVNFGSRSPKQPKCLQNKGKPRKTTPRSNKRCFLNGVFQSGAFRGWSESAPAESTKMLENTVVFRRSSSLWRGFALSQAKVRNLKNTVWKTPFGTLTPQLASSQGLASNWTKLTIKQEKKRQKDKSLHFHAATPPEQTTKKQFACRKYSFHQGSRIKSQRTETQESGLLNGGFGRRWFCRLPKTVDFDENGEKDEFSFYTQKFYTQKRFLVLRTLKKTKMTKMAVVPPAKPWFTESGVLTTPKISGTKKRGFSEGGFCNIVGLTWLWHSECQMYCWDQCPWILCVSWVWHWILQKPPLLKPLFRGSWKKSVAASAVFSGVPKEDSGQLREYCRPWRP